LSFIHVVEENQMCPHCRFCGLMHAARISTKSQACFMNIARANLVATE